MEHFTEAALSDILMDELIKEPEFNLFMIGDLMNHGIHTDFQDYFVRRQADGISSVLLRYYHSLVLYSRDIASDFFEVQEQIRRLTSVPGPWIVSGRHTTLKVLEKPFSRSVKDVLTMHFAVCRHLDEKLELPQLSRVTWTSVDDLPEVIDLLNHIPEFSATHFDLDHYRWALEKGSKKMAHIRDPKTGKVISTACLDAESDQSAMILAVGTHVDPKYRNQGYASACVYFLVQYLQKQGKSACLFYNNPTAGAIYRKLGFQEIGLWDKWNWNTSHIEEEVV